MSWSRKRGSTAQQIERTCERCGAKFTLWVSQLGRGRGRYCSHECSTQSRRQPGKQDARSYRMDTAHGHPLADKTGRVGTHRRLLYDRIGPGPHACHWCGVRVDWMPGARTKPGALVVDHIDGQRQGNDPANLVPSCHRCNSQRVRTDWVRDDEPFVVDAKGFRHRAVMRTCGTCGKEFPHLAADKRERSGRFCSRECMYSRNRPTGG